MKKGMLSVLAIVLAVFAVGCANTNKVQSFPGKPIEIIIPYAAGGATDQLGRVLEKVMKKYLPNGQTVVIVNKPGGASVVGTTEVANAKPDGYKLALVPAGSISVQPHFGNAPYKPEDFQAIARLATSPILFAVKTDAPWKSFADWHKYVQDNPDKFIYGSSGTGNPGQLGLQKFISANGLNVKYVPFQGSGQIYTALLGGHIDGEVSASQELKGQVDSKEVRVLANLGTTKNDFYKDVPTLKELGFDMSTEIYFGIVAPKGVPAAAVAVLQNAFQKAMDDPEVIATFERAGIKANYGDAAVFQKQITDDYNAFGKTLKQLGLIK
ncbi:MAG: transporter substrate-binding protein [Sporomusa sp.]|nr:transporter substrate-binding protein [Sporomusa sp.]